MAGSGSDRDVTHGDLVKIGDLVDQEPVARKKWHLVMNKILFTNDVQRIQEVQDFNERVLQTLQQWRAYGAQKKDLLAVLYQYGLNALADKIQQQQLLINSKFPERIRFEVGEVVYNFIGRESGLVALHTKLTESRSEESSTANLVCVFGLGGIGKSALVRKYAYQYRYAYDGNIIWIQADTPESMRASFQRLATRIGLRILEATTNEEIAGQIYSWFNGKSCLFIFDDVQCGREFQQFQYDPIHIQLENPDYSKLHVLLTSRRHELVSNARKQLHLIELSIGEAEEFIQDAFGDVNADPASVTELAQTLHRLPLALQQSIAFIRQKYIKDSQLISKYLEEFRTNEEKILRDIRFQGYVRDYTQTTYTTWRRTLTTIETQEHGPTAIRLINLLSYMSTHRFSSEFLGSVPILNVNERVRDLELLSMIQSMIGTGVDTHMARINRLVQCVNRLHLSPEKKLNALELGLEFARGHFRNGDHADANTILDSILPFCKQLFCIDHHVRTGVLALKAEVMMNIDVV